MRVPEVRLQVAATSGAASLRVSALQEPEVVGAEAHPEVGAEGQEVTRVYTLDEIAKMPRGENGGYVIRYLPKSEYRYGSTAWAFEHRLVMEAMLGRLLGQKEDVHHENRNKQDNTPTNLELKDKASHGREHAPLLGHVVECAVCREPFYLSRSWERRGRTACSGKCAAQLPLRQASAAKNLRPPRTNHVLNRKVVQLRDRGLTWNQVAKASGLTFAGVRDRYERTKKKGGANVCGRGS